MKKPAFSLEPANGCQRVMIPKDGEIHCIGEIFPDTLVTKRDPAKHLLRRWNAYGINAELIDSGLFTAVVIEEPTQQLFIAVADLKMLSQLHREGEEVQYFINRDKLQKV